MKSLSIYCIPTQMVVEATGGWREEDKPALAPPATLIFKAGKRGRTTKKNRGDRSQMEEILATK